MSVSDGAGGEQQVICSKDACKSLKNAPEPTMAPGKHGCHLSATMHGSTSPS